MCKSFTVLSAIVEFVHCSEAYSKGLDLKVDQLDSTEVHLVVDVIHSPDVRGDLRNHS